MPRAPMLCAVWFAAVVLAACSSGPSTAASSGSGGAAPDAGLGGAGGHGGELAEQPDAGCPSMNGGQACATSADCPPVVGCGFCFACEPLPNGQRACIWYPLDAGVCNPL